MKTSRYTEAQIIAILRQAEGGVPVAELCREHGMSDASFYKWRAKYGGMDASMVSQMKAIEDENRRLKRMYADLSMQADLLREALGKKQVGHPPPGRGLHANRERVRGARWPKRRWSDEASVSHWHVGPSGSARPVIVTAQS